MSFRRKRIPAQGGLLLGFVIALPDRPPLPACARPQISQPEGASQSAQGPIEGALAPEVVAINTTVRWPDHLTGDAIGDGGTTKLLYDGKTTPSCRDLLFSQFPDIDLELSLEGNDRALPRRENLTYHSGLSVTARLD